MNFRKGDKVVQVLNLGGVVTREEGTVLKVSKGVVYIDNGPGNDPTPYNAETGQYKDSYFGSRWIKKVSA